MTQYEKIRNTGQAGGLREGGYNEKKSKRSIHGSYSADYTVSDGAA